MRIPMTVPTTLLLALSPLVGCGAASFEEVAPQFEGTYAVETWTLNEKGCDAEGPSIADQLQESYLVLARGEAMGQPYLEAVSCSDAADCATKAGAIARKGSFVAWYTFSFTAATSSTELYGEHVSTGFASSDTPDCREGELADRLLETGEDGSIRIEERTRVADYPKDSRGYCTTKGTKAAAQGKTCSHLLVTTAKRLEG